MKTSWLAGCLLLSAVTSSAQFTGSEDFSASSKDTSKWGADIATGTGQLTQSGDGLLRFTCAGNTDDDSMAWPWTKGRAPFDQDWSIQVDVNVPFIALADGFAATGIGLGVRHAADPTDHFGMFLENERSPGEAQEFNFYNDLDINGVTTETAAPATGPSAALRVSWNAATKTLTASYDANGNVGGYVWTSLQTFQPQTGGWGMSPTGEFEIFVAGFAENTQVTSGQNLYADNFLVTSSTGGTGNLAGFDDFNDNIKDTDKWGNDSGTADNSMTEVSQRLEYSKLGTADGYASRPWVLNSGSYTEDWEAMVDVHLPNLSLTADGHDARLYLDVTSGSANASMQLDLRREAGTTYRRFRWLNDGPGGGEMALGTTVTDAALKVAFDAASKTLSFYHDNDAGTGGYTWNFLGSLDVDQAGTNWGMNSNSRFDIAVCGESEGVVIGIGQVYADNFRAFSGPADPGLTGFSGRDDFSGVGRSGTKWATPYVEGTSLLTQTGDGVVRYSSSSATGEDVMLWPWAAGDSPFATDWSVQVDIHMPYIALPPGHTAVGMGLGVRNSADTSDAFSMFLENVRFGPGTSQAFSFFHSVEVNDSTEEYHAAAGPSRLGAVRITWTASSRLLRAYYDADGPVNGYQWTLRNSINPVNEWGMATTSKFKITLAGYSEDTLVALSENVYLDNFYAFGTIVTPVLPVVKTLAATSITSHSAMLHGTVNAKGSEREVTFEHGPTSALGGVLNTVHGALDSTTDVPVAITLTGLSSHTKYHFRVKAAGSLGTAAGSILTFTTLNQNPVAVADSFNATLGCVMTLPVLDNDNDPDGDARSLGTYTALVPATAGKLSKVGNTLVFTASATSFTGATFTYTAKDAFGGTSAPATVTLNAVPCMISPTLANPSSAPITYPVSITSTGAWSVTESLPWVSVSPVSGFGDAVTQVTVQPHTTTKPRSGSLFIGGQEHRITQDRVYQPVLTPPSLVPPGVVSGYYELVIPTQNLPVTYTVTNLPPGLKLDGNLGLLSGRPTKGGNYDMTIKAANAAGKAVTTLSLPTLVIADLRPGLVGSFLGFAGREEELNQRLGSRVEFTVATTGAISGKCIIGATPLPFSGVLDSQVNDQDHPTATVIINRPKDVVITMQLSFDQVGGEYMGTLSAPGALPVAVEGWRNPWHAKNKVPAYYRKLHTLCLKQPVASASLPQGHGYASLASVAEGTGACTLAGRLADGSTLTSSGFLGESGALLLYVPLYSNRGSLLGRLTLTPHDAMTPDNAITGMPTWFKAGPLTGSKDTLYKDGFEPLALEVQGGAYVPLAPGGLLFGLTSADPEALMEFRKGGLDTEGKEFTQELALSNPSATGMTNVTTLVPPVLNSFKLTALSAATGAFNGEFTLAGASASQNRKVTFQGLIVNGSEGVKGYGYFILPATSAATAQRLSGSVVFGAEPP